MYNFYWKRDFAIKPSRLKSSLRFLSEQKPVQDSLFAEMWKNCEDIALQVLDTDYFKGIRNGNLDPNAYGSLMVQDAYYCFKARDSYSAAAAHAYDEDCLDFLKAKVERYDAYNEYYHKVWCIREAFGVVPGKPIVDYADYEAYVAGNLESPYVFCVMLPCEYLWYWIATELKKVVSKDSLYYFWVDTNSESCEGAMQMAGMLETYRKESVIDESKANEIFRKAMTHELEVFRTATILNENLLCQSK